MARRPTPQIVADGVEHECQFRLHALGVEANAYQDLLGAALEENFRRRGMLGVRVKLIQNDANKLVRRSAAGAVMPCTYRRSSSLRAPWRIRWTSIPPSIGI